MEEDDLCHIMQEHSLQNMFTLLNQYIVPLFMLDKTIVNKVINHFNNFEMRYWTSGLGNRILYKAMVFLFLRYI